MARFSQILSFLLLSAVTSTYATPTPEAEPAEAAAEYVELAARAPAQVITKCTVANTVALTFVGSASHSDDIFRLTFSAGACRMTGRTSTCALSPVDLLTRPDDSYYI